MPDLDPKSTTISEDIRKQLLAYRTELIGAEQKAQEEYDKTVFALSGGAFGISFAFADSFFDRRTYSARLAPLGVDSLGHQHHIRTLLLLLQQQGAAQDGGATTRAVSNNDLDSIYGETPGGRYTGITSFLNIVGGLLFLLGAILLVVFVYHNLAGHAIESVQP